MPTLLRAKTLLWTLALGPVGACSTPRTDSPSTVGEAAARWQAPEHIPGEVHRDGGPAAGVRVLVFAPLLRLPVFTTETDAEGRFAIPYTVDELARAIHLQVGETLDLHLLVHPHATVTLTLRHDGGQWQTAASGADVLPVEASRQAYQRYLDEALAVAQAGDDANALVDRQWAEIGAYDDPHLRTMTQIHYATYLSQLVGPERFLELFEIVAADDPLWAVQSEFIVELLWVMGDRGVAQDYAAKLLASQREPGVLASVRYAQLIALNTAGKGAGDPAWDEAWAQLCSDELAATAPASNARGKWDDARPIMVGKQMPALAWASLEGDDEIRTTELAGQAYLLDVWSTWCRPCMEAMPELHALYDELNDEGEPPRVEFVSLSVDEERRDVLRVRAGEWPMPWRHAWSPKGEVVPGWALPSMPMVVLVGADGTVLALTRTLDDPALVQALQHIIAP